ncbi:hypothetical protein ANN_23003 [Periplaneta americana]|uniref:Mariner Mos1 transposase n=1 Tax=Periplaneta americana TaxID=6978 RepID=A0ABQ8SJZ4_PERAM|nr:hypothetical protein ANN_23003 [Periplaneta americana]
MLPRLRTSHNIRNIAEDFSCAAQQLNASQSTHRFSFVNHTIKTVNMPKCAVSSTQKFLVQQHITTSKHQANKQLNSKQRQLFLTQPTTSNVRSEFNIDLCRSLISADIPLYKLKNKGSYYISYQLSFVSIIVGRVQTIYVNSTLCNEPIMKLNDLSFYQTRRSLDQTSYFNVLFRMNDFLFSGAAERTEGLLLVGIMPHGTTINSDGYVAILKKLQVRLSRVRRHREKQDVLLLHDNAQPYVSHKTTDQIRKFG